MLRDKLANAISTYRMFGTDDLVVVGVSGGPDSVALLHALTALSAERHFRLHVAHLDHGLRGSASSGDAEYVAALAHSLGWAITAVVQDVSVLAAERSLGLEEAGRIARFEYFAQSIRECGAVGVAIGHTADDQIETVVMHWLRGAGSAGLRGMRPVTDLRLRHAERTFELRVFRPMLAVRRGEVEGYCRAHQLHPRDDDTNLDLRFTRNQVRLQLIPAFRRFNPGWEEGILRSARVAAAEDDFLQSEAISRWPTVMVEQGDRIVFDLAAWRATPRAIQFRLLREAVARLRGDVTGYSSTHFVACVGALDEKPAGMSLCLPGGLRLVKRYADFTLGFPRRTSTGLTSNGEPFAVPGTTAVAGGALVVRAELRGRRCQGERAEGWHADLDLAAVGDRLTIRRRRAGDRFQPLGMAYDKKLQDFLVDAKVPREARDGLPVITNDGNIAWLAGLRIAQWAKVTPATEAVLCLRLARAGKAE